VRVLVSNPPYDPNLVPEHLSALNRDPASPLLDRATQGQYPPGSTFKVVTAAAGLDSGTITPETTIDAPGTIEVQGQPLSNDFNQSFGPIALDTALTNSVNTWFAQLGEQLGADTMFEYMDAFGFGSTPAIDLPADQVYTSGIFEGGELLGRNDPVDVARVAFGQERLAVTPLQMAEVAAAVANGGSLMKPQIWSRVVDPDGRVTERLDPSRYSRPIDEETAAELTTAMEGVVSEGTGTNAAIPGVAVAGKTGTAETPFNETCGGGSEENQAWFIGFAPADDPQIAIAATVECTTAFGGDIAAPIFRDVAETILNGGS
jgi:peptidoglycan glycosyltransferase